MEGIEVLGDVWARWNAMGLRGCGRHRVTILQARWYQRPGLPLVGS